MAEFRGWAEAMVEGAQRAGMEPAVVQELAQVDSFFQPTRSHLEEANQLCINARPLRFETCTGA